MLTYVCDDRRHLVCVPFSIDNLHAMARDLDIKPCWYHGGRRPHYDIPKRRVDAITARCVQLSSRELFAIITTPQADVDASLDNAISNGYLLADWTDDLIAEDISQYDAQFEEAPLAAMALMIGAWRRRRAISTTVLEGGAAC